MKKLFEKITNIFKKIIFCKCPCSPHEDPLCGKLFKHYKTEKIYQYLLVASPELNRSELVVVYQDIESKLIYTLPWNEFFSNTGTKGNTVPRFKEQK